MRAALLPIDRSFLSIHHRFLDGSDDARRWARWLKQIEKITGLQLERLDTRDPLRRKVTAGTWDEQGEFMTSFQPRHNSRWIFGRFSDPRVRVRIVLYRDRPDYCDTVAWTVEPDAFPPDQLADRLVRLFDCGNRVLRSFFAIADTEENFATKSKESGYGVDLQEELSGVFWLTYFNRKYCEFFGRDTLAGIREAEFLPLGGVRIQLGASPLKYRHARRLQIERKLGPESFVNPRSRREKEQGAAVLTYTQLRRK